MNPFFDLVTMSDKAFAITLLESNTDQWTADAIAKKKNEEYGFGPIVVDDISGDNNASWGMLKKMMMITNPIQKWTKIVKKKKVLVGNN